MEYPAAVILPVSVPKKSGETCQADLYDVIQPVIETVWAALRDFLSDMEYHPERATSAALRGISARLALVCRCAADMLSRISGKETYCFLIHASDYPLKEEMAGSDDWDEYDVRFPVGVTVRMDGQDRSYAANTEMLFSSFRLDKKPDWYLAWARQFFGIAPKSESSPSFPFILS